MIHTQRYVVPLTLLYPFFDLETTTDAQSIFPSQPGGSTLNPQTHPSSPSQVHEDFPLASADIGLPKYNRPIKWN